MEIHSNRLQIGENCNKRPQLFLITSYTILCNTRANTDTLSNSGLYPVRRSSSNFQTMYLLDKDLIAVCVECVGVYVSVCACDAGYNRQYSCCTGLSTFLQLSPLVLSDLHQQVLRP